MQSSEIIDEIILDRLIAKVESYIAGYLKNTTMYQERLAEDRIIIIALQHFKATRNQLGYREGMLRAAEIAKYALDQWGSWYDDSTGQVDPEVLALNKEVDAILAEAGESKSPAPQVVEGGEG